MDQCQHKSGDFIEGIWVCGHCFKKLDERPRRYFTRYFNLQVDGGDSGEGSSRQEVVYAPIMSGADGTTLDAFVQKMARRLMVRGGLQKTDAINYAIDLLASLRYEFKGECFLDEADAWDMVDEDMSYWEENHEGN